MMALFTDRQQATCGASGWHSMVRARVWIPISGGIGARESDALIRYHAVVTYTHILVPPILTLMMTCSSQYNSNENFLFK